MSHENASIPVEELIRRYNQELMEFQKKHAAVKTGGSPFPATSPENQLDRDFPAPDVQRDLQKMREEQPVREEQDAAPVMAEAVTEETERQRELEPGEMAPPPGIAPTADNAVGQRELTPGEMEPPPGVELPRGTLFMNDIQRQQSGSARPNAPAGNQTAPAQPLQGIPGFPLSPGGQEIVPTPAKRDMSLGYLRISVTTGRGTLPVQNAQVIVVREVDGEERLEQANRTDSSGLSPLFTLPAVSSVYSQSPDNANPYTYYTVYVRAPGFYPVQLRQVPMYGGVTSILPVDLIPVAEGGNPNDEQMFDGGAPQNLQ